MIDLEKDNEMNKLKELEEWIKDAFQACHVISSRNSEDEYYSGKAKAFDEVLTKIKELQDETTSRDASTVH